MKNIKKPKAVGEFRDFVLRGNIIDMAVGVIIGGAFKEIVTSLVNNILMPVIGSLLGNDFTNLSVLVNGVDLKYGVFVQNIIDFLLIALCMFVFVKIVAKIKSLHEKPAVEEVAEPVKSDEVKLLEEIRDALKKK